MEKSDRSGDGLPFLVESICLSAPFRFGAIFGIAMRQEGAETASRRGAGALSENGRRLLRRETQLRPGKRYAELRHGPFEKEKGVVPRVQTCQTALVAGYAIWEKLVFSESIVFCILRGHHSGLFGQLYI